MHPTPSSSARRACSPEKTRAASAMSKRGSCPSALSFLRMPATNMIHDSVVPSGAVLAYPKSELTSHMCSTVFRPLIGDGTSMRQESTLRQQLPCFSCLGETHALPRASGRERRSASSLLIIVRSSASILLCTWTPSIARAST